jgi:type VI secretion system secreted protein Hcp
MATPFFLKVHGSRQGNFKGESKRSSRTDWIEGLDFAFELWSPYDVATGHTSGKRQWKPIVVTKEWGASSPQFLQALATNEVLTSVVLEFVALRPDGTEETSHTVQLTNGAVTDVSQFIGPAPLNPVSTLELTRIAFTFQKIEVRDVQGKTAFADDWPASPLFLGPRYVWVRSSPSRWTLTPP